MRFPASSGLKEQGTLAGYIDFSLFIQAVLTEWWTGPSCKLVMISLQMPFQKWHISKLMQNRNFLFTQLTICIAVAPSSHLCTKWNAAPVRNVPV